MDDLRTLVLTRFPFPIAHGYLRVLEPETASVAADCVFYTYESTLRFTTLVLLSEFLRSDREDPRLVQAVKALRTPGIERWYEALNRLSKHFSSRKRPDVAPRQGSLSAPLVEAVQTLPRLGWNAKPVHQALRDLRNEKGHSVPWGERECASRLPELQTMLEVVLRHFWAVADIALLRRSPGGMIRLVGCQEPFDEHPVEDPHLARLFEESELLAQGAEGDAVPLYPLFLGPRSDPEGYTEPLLVFAGHTSRAVVYLGSRSRIERNDALVPYLDLLRRKNLDPRFTKDDAPPWEISSWAKETTLSTLDGLRGVKYFPEFYQERLTPSDSRGAPSAPSAVLAASLTAMGTPVAGGVDDAVGRWLAAGPESGLIVASRPGAGKTSLFCRVAERLMGEGRDCVLLLVGSTVRSQGLFPRIRAGLGFSDDVSAGGVTRFEEILRTWLAVGRAEDIQHDERRLVILLDAVNEAADPGRLLDEVADLAAVAARSNREAGRLWVRLLVSVRATLIDALISRWGRDHDAPFFPQPENFAYFRDERGRALPYLPLREFSEGEAGAAYERAQRALVPGCRAPWSTLDRATRDLLRHPLMVLLFHRAFAGEAAAPLVDTPGALWDAWLGRTFEPRSGGEALERFALDLADACMETGASGVPADLVDDWRAAWHGELRNDPVRIAAALDPLERLADAGIFRPSLEEGWQWVSDSLAEQVWYRALLRRDPSALESSVRSWLSLPPSTHLDGALTLVGLRAWQEGRVEVLSTLMENERERGVALVGRILADVALQAARGRRPLTADFGDALRGLAGACWSRGGAGRATRLKDAFWEAGRTLSSIGLFQGRVQDELLVATAEICDRLVGESPGDPQNDEDLAATEDLADTYERLLEHADDPTSRAAWVDRALELHNRIGARRFMKTPAVMTSVLLCHYTRVVDIGMQPFIDHIMEYRSSSFLRERLVRSYTRVVLWGCAVAGYLGRWLLDTRAGRDVVRQMAFQAVDRYPSIRDFLTSLGDAYMALARWGAKDDHERALRFCRRGAALRELLVWAEPWKGSHLGDLAEAYHQLGKLEETRAAEWLRRGLAALRREAALKPDAIYVLFRQMALLLDLAELDGATIPRRSQARFQQALRLSMRISRHPSVSDAEAWAFLAVPLLHVADFVRRSQCPEVLEELRGRAIEAAAELEDRGAGLSGRVPVHYMMAFTHEGLGQHDAALGALRRAIELGEPDWDWLSKDSVIHALKRELDDVDASGTASI